MAYMINETLVNAVFAQQPITEQPPCYLVELGNLQLSAPKLIAEDPAIYAEEEPFTQDVPTGRFPVVLAIAKFGEPEDADERVAFARINFSNEPIVRWQMAMTPLQQDNLAKSPLGKNHFFGYGIDSGTGCFMSQRAKQMLTNFDENEFFNKLSDLMENSYQSTRSYGLLTLDNSGENIAVFSSGFGDGYYPSFFGFDKQDNLVCLVTDFLVLD